MLFSETGDNASDYHRLLAWLFSGDIDPGSKVAERVLARKLGISRNAAHELIRELVTQGLLVGGEKWEGVRTRAYIPEEIQQLAYFRESLEGAAVRAAAAVATEIDLARMTIICDEAETKVGSDNSEHWVQLEYNFHMAIAKASHNERLVHHMKHLLAECAYVFYVPRIEPAEENVSRRSRVVKEHRAVLEAIRAGDADRAEKLAKAHVRTTGMGKGMQVLRRDASVSSSERRASRVSSEYEVTSHER